jgi:hypothetical protein
MDLHEDPDGLKEKQKSVSKKKHHFKAWEDELIKQNWQTMTDVDLADKLNRTTLAISRRRKALGLSKKNGRPKAKTRKKAIFKSPNEYNLATLSKEDRIEFYKTKFDENPRYFQLVRILTPEELEYYRHKYIDFLDSIDTLSFQEEDLLHSMLMTEMQVIRIQESIREAYDTKDDSESGRMSTYMFKDLNDAEQRYIKYQEKLNLTREQRLRNTKEQKVSVSTLVRAFLERKNREEAGKTAGILAHYQERCKEDMSKYKFLLGD